MIRLLLFSFLLTQSFISIIGQNCLTIIQLEKIAQNSTSYGQINKFLYDNNYELQNSKITSSIISGDSLTTLWYKNIDNDNSSVFIHSLIGTSARLVEYYDPNCALYNSIRLSDNKYILIKDMGTKTYRKGLKTILVSPEGRIVLDARGFNEQTNISLNQNIDRATIRPSVRQEIQTLIPRDDIEKQSLAELKNLKEKINLSQTRAEALFNDEKYDLALEEYNSLLLLDKSNKSVAEKIILIKKIQELLNKRKTTIFSYKSTNYSDYSQFKNNLLNDINLQVNKNPIGYINLNYLISFDTSGLNHSSAKNISTSIPDYNTYLSNICHNGTLKPSSEEGYFLASEESLALNLNWNTITTEYISNSKGIFTDNKSIQYESALASFSSTQSFKYGKYTIEVKNKEFNGILYSDESVIAFKTIGPKAALFSTLMPGLGTFKATYGEKGRGHFTLFLISSSISIGSKLYSEIQYKNYLEATNQLDIDKYYNNANISHKFSLLSGGLSASIYLYDIFNALSLGTKNLKLSKSLRMKLNQGPVPIQRNSLQW
jgi:hypothetical protein